MHVSLRIAQHITEPEKELVDAQSKSLLGYAPVYKSSSHELMSRYKLDREIPHLMVFKDFDHTQPVRILPLPPLPSSTTSAPSESATTDTDEIHSRSSIVHAFLHDNRLPTLSELTSGNFDDYMKDGRKFVVVVMLSRKGLGEREFGRRKAVVEEMSRTWRREWGGEHKSEEERSVGKSVDFVWVRVFIPLFRPPPREKKGGGTELC